MTGRQSLGEAIRQAAEAKGWSQRALGEKVAAAEGRPEPYAQSVVQNWYTKAKNLPAERVFLIEKLLGVPAGSISRYGGFVPIGADPVLTVDDAVKADLALSDRDRDALLGLYHALAGNGNNPGK